MSDIPKRGYGSWAQWKRRWTKRGGTVFFVNDGVRFAQDEWILRHSKNVNGKVLSVATATSETA